VWARSESCSVTQEVSDFIVDYLTFRGVVVECAVDLWSDCGQILAPILDRTGGSGLGLCNSSELARNLSSRFVDMTWVEGEPSGPQASMPDVVELIVGMPPWHWAPTRLKRVTRTGEIITLTDDPANVAIVDACRRLSPRGLGFFAVGPGFLMRPGANTVMARIAEFGLHIDGVVELSRGSIRPDHGAAQLLLVLSTRPQVCPIFGKSTRGAGSFGELLSFQEWHHSAVGTLPIN
jgi:hypothetical protein